MKTTKVLFVAMLLSLAFMWSCQKEGVMTPDASGSQSKSLTDAEKAFIANLQSKLDKIKTGYNGNTQNRVDHRNPDNPFDAYGQLHNDYVAYGAEHLKTIRNGQAQTFNYTAYVLDEAGVMTSQSFTETYSSGEGKMFGISAEYANSHYGTSVIQPVNVSVTEVPDMVDNIDSDPLYYIDQRYNNNEMSELVHELWETIGQVDGYDDFDARISGYKQIESDIQSSSLFTTAEKNGLLYALAIGRYSNYYWEFEAPNVGDDSDPDTQFRLTVRGETAAIIDRNAAYEAYEFLSDNFSYLDVTGLAGQYGNNASLDFEVFHIPYR